GVPLGLFFGTRYGWNVPFLLLAALGCGLLAGASRALPRIGDHLGKSAMAGSPLARMWETLTLPNHLRAFALVLPMMFRAFALVVTVMFGGFAVTPFISPSMVANVGVSERSLPLLYVVGGGLTLVASPIIGKLADRYGKLRMYRIVAPLAAVMMVVVTNLPP